MFHVNNEDEIELLISCLKPRKIIKVVCVLRERNAYLVSPQKTIVTVGHSIILKHPISKFYTSGVMAGGLSEGKFALWKMCGCKNLINLEFVKSPNFLPKLWVACNLPRELLDEGDVSWKNITEGKSIVPQVRLVESDVRGFNILLVNYSFFCAKPKDKFHRSKTGPIVSTSLQDIKNIIEREGKL